MQLHKVEATLLKMQPLWPWDTGLTTQMQTVSYLRHDASYNTNQTSVLNKVIRTSFQAENERREYVRMSQIIHHTDTEISPDLI